MTASEPPSLTLGPGAPVAVVDVGGTEVKAAVLDGAGRLGPVAHQSTPRGRQVVPELLDLLAEHVHAARVAEPGLAAVGVVVPGIVDAANGIGVHSENLGWRGVPVRELLRERTGLPVGFGHDVASAGRAELLLGAGRGGSDVAVVVIGTGIAAALFVAGEPLLVHGYAGEIGHSVVDPAGPRCVCTARGCLEAIASSAAIARRYAGVSGDAAALPGGSREVLDRMQAGDEVAAQVWDEAVVALAAAVRQLAATVSPELVVVGGGLSRAGEALLAPLRERIADAVPPHRVPQLRQAALGSYAGLVGAAMLARESLSARVSA